MEQDSGGQTSPTVSPEPASTPKTRAENTNDRRCALTVVSFDGKGLTVDRILQRLASLELRLLGRGDLDPLAGARIAAFAGRPMRNTEGAEPDQTHFIATRKCAADRVEDAVYGPARIGFGKTRAIGDACNQIILIQSVSPSEVIDRMDG